MRRIFLTTILLFISVGLFFSAAVASAHVLKVDGSIGSTLHVDPADNPVVGSPATFYFEIKDKQNKFTSEGCSCSVTISTSQGEVLHTEQLFTQSSAAGFSNPLLQYVFEKGGVYTVTLTGMPKAPGAFQDFQLKYDVRVENAGVAGHADTAKGNSSDVWLYGGLGLLVLIVFALLVLQRKKKGRHISPLLLLFGVVAAGSALFYSGHFFELATPARVHHHIVGETGHADKTFHTIAPHTMAAVATVSFLGVDYILGDVVLITPPDILTFVSNAFNTRAPPALSLV